MRLRRNGKMVLGAMVKWCLDLNYGVRKSFFRNLMRRLTVFGFAWFIGCVAPNPGGTSPASDARVTINAWLPAPLAAGMLKVKVDDGRTVWNLTGADFQLVGGTQHKGPALQTTNHGTLTVSYALIPLGSSVAVSAGAIELPLKKDWSYGVDIHADTANPSRSCFGCSGSRAFPLAPNFRSSRADSVYMVWGGNSITNPVIY